MDRKIGSAIEIAMQQLMETHAPMRDAAEEANDRMACAGHALSCRLPSPWHRPEKCDHGTAACTCAIATPLPKPDGARPTS